MASGQKEAPIAHQAPVVTDEALQREAAELKQKILETSKRLQIIEDRLSELQLISEKPIEKDLK